MFILSNIKVATPEVLFFPHSRKFLKFQVNKSTKRHPFPSKFVNAHLIQWDADMNFPAAIYDRPLAFEIYVRHQFGYHEEELTSVLHGEIKIEKGMDFADFEVRRAGETVCAGYLSCRIRHREETVEEIVQTRIAKKQLLTIKSIIAHIPAAVRKKIQCRLAVGRQEVRTASIHTFCGDLVFPDCIVMRKTDFDKTGILSVWELKGSEEVKLGEGKVALVGAKPLKKVTLINANEQLLGEAYVDSMQQFQEDEETPIKSNSLPNYLHKKTPSQSPTNGKLTPFKKISVVSNNQSIIFSTSQRFKETHNPEFMGTRSSGKSKLSFGQLRQRLSRSKQEALIPIAEEGPGVGRYNLPTIWDRY